MIYLTGDREKQQSWYLTRGEDKIRGKFVGSGKGVWIWWKGERLFTKK